MKVISITIVNIAPHLQHARAQILFVNSFTSALIPAMKKCNRSAVDHLTINNHHIDIAHDNAATNDTAQLRRQWRKRCSLLHSRGPLFHERFITGLGFSFLGLVFWLRICGSVVVGFVWRAFDCVLTLCISGGPSVRTHISRVTEVLLLVMVMVAIQAHLLCDPCIWRV